MAINLSGLVTSSLKQVRDSRVQGATKAGNLDFDARVPIPISVFPSTYRSDATSAETTTTKVEGEVNLGAANSSRVGREDTRFSGQEEVGISVNQSRPGRDTQTQGDVHVFQDRNTQVYAEKDTRVERDSFRDVSYRDDRQYRGDSQQHRDNFYRPNQVNVDITRERIPTSGPAEIKDVNVDVQINRGSRIQDSYDVVVDRPSVRDRTLETQLDVTEREYRRRVNPTFDIEYERRRPVANTEVTVERETIQQDRPLRNKVDMGYYDDEGQYHSFRRGVQRAVDHIVHPFSHHSHHDRVEVDVEEGPSRMGGGGGGGASVRYVEPRGGANANTVTIPCHFIRVGDLLILQGRPCQVIRISTSAQTGQYRYLGVDLFTKQLQEESSFVSNPEPSVVVQSMLGPVYKQYRVLDLRADGAVVCMTETGDVKQGLPVVDQGNLYGKIDRAFADGRGSVRALVINDGGRELVVDYKVIHASRL